MPRRDVSVGLELEVKGYIGPAEEALVASKVLRGEVRDLGDEIKDTGHDMVEYAADAKLAEHATNDLGDKARRTERDFKGLDDRIKEARLHVGQMALAFTKSGSDIDKQNLKSARKALENLKELRREMVKTLGEGELEAAGVQIGSKVGGGLIEGIMNTIKGVGKLSMWEILGPAIAAASPLLGAAISGAIVGGVGIGGIAGGVLSAIHNPAVQSAFAQFKQDISADFFRGGAFDKPIVESLKMIESDFRSLNLGDTFAKGAQALPILVSGIDNFVKNLMPGFDRVMSDSQPIAAALAKGLASLGHSISTVFVQMDTPGGIHALEDVLVGVGKTLVVVGGLIHVLADIYEGIRVVVIGLDELKHKLEDVPVAGKLLQLGDFIASALPKALIWAIQKFDDLDQTSGATLTHVDHYMEAVNKSAAQLVIGMDNVSVAAKQEADAMRTLATDLDDALNKTLSLDQANTQVNQSMLDLNKAMKDNGKHWKDNTQAAVDNHNAVDSAIQAAISRRDAEIAASDGSQAAIQKINKEYDDQIAKIDAIATKLGDIPGDIKTKYTIDITTVGNANLKDVLTGVGSQGRLEDTAHQHQASPSHRAAGGSVMAGRQYIVNEQRGEGFIPSGGMRWTAPTNGYITPTMGAGGDTYVIAPIQIGDEVVRVVRTQIDETNRSTRRAVGAGFGR